MKFRAIDIAFVSVVLFVSTNADLNKLPANQNITTISGNTTAEDLKVEFYDLLTDEPLRRIQFRQRRGPCSCLNFNCGCCAGMDMRPQNFRRKLCSNFTYDPNEFQIQLDVIMNEDVLYQNMFSAKNPPPICMPIPYTPAQMCIKFFNIFTPGRNIHMCMDVEAKTEERPLMLLHFDCVRMGQDGIVLLKPEEMGGQVGGGGGGGGGLFGLGLFGNRPTSSTQQPPLVQPGQQVTDVSQIDADVFDQITEIKLKP